MTFSLDRLRPGAWIWINGPLLYGPFAQITKVTSQRVYFREGLREVYISREDVAAVGDARSDVEAALSAYNRVHEGRKAKLDALKEIEQKSRRERNDYEIETRIIAMAAARKASGGSHG